jgi:5-methylcytosine-specific restriction protein A
MELMSLVLGSRFPEPAHKLVTLYHVGRSSNMDDWDELVSMARFANVPVDMVSKYVLDLTMGPLQMGPVVNGVMKIFLVERDLRALAAGRAEFRPAPYNADFFELVALDPNTGRARGKIPIPPLMRLHVFARDGYRCRQCGSAAALQADHVFPESRGGKLELANLQTLCASCNRSKGPSVPDGAQP